MSNPPPVPPVPAGDSKSQPTKKLPTFRVGFAKQLDALRAYAVLSENGSKSVHYTKVGEIIKVHEANVSSMNPFFLEVGFIEKKDAGYVPTAAVVEYNRAHSWNAETAPRKLASIINNSWFGLALSRRLQFRTMSDDEAIRVLGDECSAKPESKPQLRMLLDYCEAAGTFQRSNGQLQAIDAYVFEAGPAATSEPSAPMSEPLPAPAATAPVARPQPITSTLLPGPAGGAISLQFNIDVPLADMKDWSPERITAFFAGFAQILAAKNG